MKLPLAVCTRYDELGASSRLRYYAYRAALEEGGFAVRMLPFFGRAYLKRLYGGGGKSRWLAAAALLRRLAALPGLPERLLIEYELLPSLPAGVEQALALLRLPPEQRTQQRRVRQPVGSQQLPVHRQHPVILLIWAQSRA